MTAAGPTDPGPARVPRGGSHGEPAGTLTLSAEIRCGRCRAWWMTAKAANRTQAAKMARSRGWRLTKWDGWACPGCLEKKGARRWP